MERRHFIAFAIQCFLIYNECVFTAAQSIQVTLSEGVVRGKRETIEGTANLFNLFQGNPYYSFLGIPYAQPPVGPLRFKSPQPPSPWSGVRDALNTGPACIQATDIVSGSEDCLYINVYIRELPKPGINLKPVMFWIHGGGFFMGNGFSTYGPDFLITKDIILVTCNYRLGPLGFLSLEDDLLTGNFGLKDQTMALEWVKKNIASFGGNPAKVTIFGESAGGASVDYHLLSPLSKGLFQQAIVQSGTALNPWAFNPTPRATAIRLAKHMGLQSNDTKQMFEFFKNASASALTKAAAELTTKETADIRKTNTAIFAPCVEVRGTGEKFITKSPRDILQGGDFNKVPLIIGTVDAEGILFLLGKMITADDFKQYNNISDWAVPLNWNIEPKLEKDQLGLKIKKYFFKDSQVSWSTINSFVEIITDSYFLMDTQTTLTAHLKHSTAPVYNYEFTYVPTIPLKTQAILKQLQLLLNLKGATHGEDLRMLFHLRGAQLILPLFVKDKQVSEDMVTMWTNFAKTGNPNLSATNGTWKPLAKDNLSYLEIGSVFSVKQGKVQQERLKFWQDLCKSSSTKYACDDL